MNKKYLVFILLFFTFSMLYLQAKQDLKKDTSKDVKKTQKFVDEDFCENLKDNLLSKYKKLKDSIEVLFVDDLTFKIKYFPDELNNKSEKYSSLFEVEITDEDIKDAQEVVTSFSNKVNGAFSKIKEKPFVDHYVLQICRTYKSIDVKSANFTKEASGSFSKSKEQVLYETELLIGQKQDFMNAVDILESGDYEGGIKKLREFIKKNPNSPLVNDAHIKISEAFIEIKKEIQRDLSPKLPDYGYKDNAAFEKILTLIDMGKQKLAMTEISNFVKKYPLSKFNKKLQAIKFN